MSMRQMVTEFADGTVIGWDQCNIRNGGCGKHVRVCACNGGPKEPEVFARWRQDSSWPGADLLPQVTAPSKNPTPKIKPAAERRAEAGLGDMPGHPSVDGVDVDEVVCVIHGEFVKCADADQNDDATWTCHSCQEAGTERPRSE